MKICLPVLENKGMESQVFGHFGSAPCFAVYNSDTKSIIFSTNDESAHEHGKCMPVDALRTLGAEAVLCRGMGLRAANLLVASGIKPFLVDAETVSEALEKFDRREVRVLDEATSCHAHECH